jgi:hypothetical protein
MVGGAFDGRASFAQRAALLHAHLRRGGVPVADMRGAPALELQFAGLGAAATPGARPAIEPLEGRIEARRVASARATDSRIRYFLDGAQRTLPFVRIGTVPVSAVVAAAGIVEREPGAGCAMAAGTMRFAHAWLAPAGLPDAAIRRFVEEARAMGMTVVDPLAAADIVDPEAMASDYGAVQERVYRAARAVREDLERAVLDGFRGPDDPHRRHPGWLVVDGRLPAPRPQTLGLVKQFSDAGLSGDEAAMLLSLPQGHRTTAFSTTAGRRFGEAAGDRTLWYLRMWDHDRLDAHHALVRVEAPGDVRSSAEIDEISGWLLAERTPRATGDDRWATLLYPVHQLERILKRRIDGDTRGWAGR